MTGLQTHLIDYDNINLYFVDNSSKTMKSAFLDGSNIEVFHKPREGLSLFHNVSDMIFYNQVSHEIF